MELIRRCLTKNPCYQANLNKADSRYVSFQNRGPVGLMLHSVGCSQPSAQVFINQWDNASYTYSCVHGIIDANTGTVYQLLPWNYRGWHGGGSCNNTHVGVEMCESRFIRYLQPGESGYAPGKFVVLDREKAVADARRAYRAAAELFAQLCGQYGLDPTRDIVSHAEGGKKGIASGHGDPEHYWSGLGLEYTMDGFRRDVKERMRPANPFTDVAEDSYCYEAVLWAVQNGITVGTDASHFSPDLPCTRGQVVTMLHRMAKRLPPEGGASGN